MKRVPSLWLVMLVCLATPSRAATVRVPLTVAEPSGLSRSNGHVTAGIPFPIGIAPSNASLRLLDPSRRSVPVQYRATATWRDGSVKWMLLDFQTDLKPHEVETLTLELNEPDVARPRFPAHARENAEAVVISVGPLSFSVARRRFEIFGDLIHEGKPLAADALVQSLALANEFSNLTPRVLAPEEIRIEEPGPLRVTLRISGWIDDGNGNRLLQYLVRLHAFANSTAIELEHTSVQMSPQIKMLWLKDWSLRLGLRPGASATWSLGAVPANATGPLSNTVWLTQCKENESLLRGGDGSVRTNTRAAGWLEIANEHGQLVVAVKDFWPQFPKAIRLSPGELRLGLFPEESGEPFDFDQGLAKTHRLLFQFQPALTNAGFAPDRLAQQFEQPLFAVAPAQWYCDAKVFGEVAPFDFDLFPDYEMLTEASGDQFIKSMATGWRNWGDFYYGGPYKGKNAYRNLEYDLPHNFLVQFARTGQRKYLEAARTMAQHQADIDLNHFTKWQWKHSPRHTETQAEFGHTFTRGLLENFYLTGHRRSLEAALELGDSFAIDFQRPSSLGNERQIGWGLISLLPVYEATWDPRYLTAVTNALDRLLAGLDARGKFKIRWDNRIAFFNGIAATGLIYAHRATGDERMADAALRVIRRTKGFYPEYAGRTLEALAWAYQRTNDPEYLDLLNLTYETTMARALGWNSLELGAMTIFTVHALPFMERSGFARRPADPLKLPAELFASENGLHAHHLPHGEGDVYLRAPKRGGAMRLVLIRKGAWKAAGSARLFDPAGRRLREITFPAEPVIWQRESFALSNIVAGAYRLELRAPSEPNQRHGSFITWDVVTAQPLPAVLTTPRFVGLEFVTPRLFSIPMGDAETIDVALVGEGEGFKKAVLYDPDGCAAATLEAFVDLGDQGRHEYKLSAKIPAAYRERVWSLSLQDVAMTRLSGLEPIFSTSAAAFFQPERAP